jgi:lipoteichoic acid synthase
MTHICEQDLITSKTSLIEFFTKTNSYSLFSDQEKNWIRDKNIKNDGLDSLFFLCRDLAFKKKYMESRAGLKHLLNKGPNYADPRTLLGRSLAWQGADE